MDPLLIHPRDSNYTRSELNPALKPPLSPEELQSRRQKTTLPFCQQEQSEVWALGLIILSLSLLLPEETFYNWENLLIKWEIIEENLQKLASLYSQPLLEIVKGCLGKGGVSPDSQRISIKKIRQMVEERRASGEEGSSLLG